jgi:hypothetical protein
MVRVTPVLVLLAIRAAEHEKTTKLKKQNQGNLIVRKKINTQSLSTKLKLLKIETFVSIKKISADPYHWIRERFEVSDHVSRLQTVHQRHPGEITEGKHKAKSLMH